MNDYLLSMLKKEFGSPSGLIYWAAKAIISAAIGMTFLFVLSVYADESFFRFCIICLAILSFVR